jgi:osmoprotectant transport system permease protein
VELLVKVVQWFLDPSHWQGDFGIPHRLSEHIGMSAVSTLTAAAIALPVGIVLGHIGRGGNLAINVSNIGRAVPSFAVLVFALEIFGIGATPAFIALVALGIPPMVTNAFVGLSEVDPDVREAARGMGLNRFQVLFGVEIPLAIPLIMAGVRTSAVNIVATATLAALVAWGGLGRFIIDGFSQQDDVQVVAGALLVAGLAMATELLLALGQFLLTPAGMRTARSEPSAEPVAA